MPHHLVAIHHPDKQDSSLEHEAMVRDIDLLNEAIGCRWLALRWRSAMALEAKSLHTQPGGKVVVTDGPFLETKEHIGGFWLLDAANMDEAIAWGCQAVVTCRTSVEVREFLAMHAG